MSNLCFNIKKREIREQVIGDLHNLHCNGRDLIPHKARGFHELFDIAQGLSNNIGYDGECQCNEGCRRKRREEKTDCGQQYEHESNKRDTKENE